MRVVTPSRGVAAVLGEGVGDDALVATGADAS